MFARVALLCALAACVAASGVSAESADRPRVTVIGDSILTAVLWNAEPTKVLSSGFDLRMEIGVCRRLTGESCPFEGKEVPTLLQVVQQLHASGELAPTVVVEVGYNDPAPTFADAVEQSIDALLDAGVTRILWVNLKEAEGQYPAMNRDLLAAARRHPEVRLVDWNTYSINKWSWFQGDGKHLTYDGALAIAGLIHTQLLGALAKPLAVAPLPPARLGRPYSARLRITGGVRPYVLRVARRHLPRGLHLLANGRLYGTPRTAGVLRFLLDVRDAADDERQLPLSLDVRGVPNGA